MSKTDNLGDFLADLANAIRTKKGTTDPINAQNFVSEIESIEGSSGNSGSTTTGEYVCRVIDYDGTILKEEYHDEGDVFTLPDLPTHDRLIAQGFSAPYDIIDNQIAVRDHELTIGVLYTTVSGLTEFDVVVDDVIGHTIGLHIAGTKDWGDGTVNTEIEHTYATAGEYTIMCDCTDIVNIDTTNACIFDVLHLANRYFAVRMGPNVKTVGDSAFLNTRTLKYVTLSNNVITIGTQSFDGCTGLSGCVALPNSVTTIGAKAFKGCSVLKYITLSKNLNFIGEQAFLSDFALSGCVVIPAGVSTIESYTFQNCTGLSGVIFSPYVTNINKQAFYCCYGLVSIKMPDSIVSIGDSAFWGCYGIAEYDFSSVDNIPSLSTDGIITTATISIGTKIIVPDSLYDEWIASSYWVNHKSIIYKASEIAEGGIV